MESAPFTQMQSQNALLVDPNTFTVETFLNLVRQMHASTTTNFDQDVFKQVNNLLQQFSKTHQAWAVTLQVLTMPGLPDREYFNAANILKNKMQTDFAALRQQDYSICFQVRDNLLLIIKRMANEGQPAYLLNTLCTALAILIMHINENWTDFVEHMSQELSDSVDHATCLLLVLKYMASECDNDYIVLEDSIRHNFFHFIDVIADQVFQMIFNQWAQKILQGGLGQVQRVGGAQSQQDQEDIQTLKLMKLRSKLVDAFCNWLKLNLPDGIFQTLTMQYPDLLQLVFAELENNKDENLENATNCVIELIQLSNKKPQYSSIKEAVIGKVQHLVGKVEQAVQSSDEELGEQLTDIFVELGNGHIQQIIQTSTMTIPQILLKLMQIPHIQSRKQVTFWKELFKQISKITDEQIRQTKLRDFEPVLLTLLDQIIIQIRAADDVFQEFNFRAETDEYFDELFRTRDDFGRVIKNIGNTCGGSTILNFFIDRLKLAMQEFQKTPDSLMVLATIESILCCIADLTKCLNSSEISLLKDVIALILDIPDKQVALKRTGAYIFQQMSGLLKTLGDGVKNDVKRFVDYLIGGFQNKFLFLPCADAFCKLCVDNAQSLSSFGEEIIENVIPKQSASNWTNKREYELILDGIGALVEHQENNQLCEKLLMRVIQPLIIPLRDKIQLAVSSKPVDANKIMKQDINEFTLQQIQGYLYLIGDFLKNCKELKTRGDQNPYAKIFEEIWVFVNQIIVEFTNLDEIIEYVIRIVKSSMRILDRGFDKYLIQFLDIVIQGYKQNHLPSFIYAVEFCLVDYHQYREYEQIFQTSFNHVSQHTIQNVLTNFDAFTFNPEIAFDYFGLCMRLIKLNKNLFFQFENINGLLSMWTYGIGIEHREAIKSHTGFFLTLVEKIRKDLLSMTKPENLCQIDHILQVMPNFPEFHPKEVEVWKMFLDGGQIIVDRALDVILEAPSREVLDYMVDILVCISFNMPAPHKQTWFTQSFARVPNNILTEEEKSNHIGYLVLTHSKKDGLLENFDILAKRARQAVKGRH